MPTVYAVAGPIDTADLGFTLMHEHIIVESPGVKENFPIIDREAEIDKAAAKLKDVMERGVNTPRGLDTRRLARHSPRERGRPPQRDAGHCGYGDLLGGAAPLPLDHRPEYRLHRRIVRQGHTGRNHGYRREGGHHQVRD